MEISDSDDSVTKEVSQEPPVVTETERLLDDGGDSSERYLTAMNATATFRLYSAVTRQRRCRHRRCRAEAECKVGPHVLLAPEGACVDPAAAQVAQLGRRPNNLLTF